MGLGPWAHRRVGRCRIHRSDLYNCILRLVFIARFGPAPGSSLAKTVASLNKLALDPGRPIATCSAAVGVGFASQVLLQGHRSGGGDSAADFVPQLCRQSCACSRVNKEAGRNCTGTRPAAGVSSGVDVGAPKKLADPVLVLRMLAGGGAARRCLPPSTLSTGSGGAAIQRS